MSSFGSSAKRPTSPGRRPSTTKSVNADAVPPDAASPTRSTSSASLKQLGASGSPPRRPSSGTPTASDSPPKLATTPSCRPSLTLSRDGSPSRRSSVTAGTSGPNTTTFRPSISTASPSRRASGTAISPGPTRGRTSVSDAPAVSARRASATISTKPVSSRTTPVRPAASPSIPASKTVTHPRAASPLRAELRPRSPSVVTTGTRTAAGLAAGKAPLVKTVAGHRPAISSVEKSAPRRVSDGRAVTSAIARSDAKKDSLQANRDSAGPPGVAAPLRESLQEPLKVQVTRERPSQQAQLTTEELDEEVTRVLLATNSAISIPAAVTWSLKDLEWKATPITDPVMEHTSVVGHLIHVNTPFGKAQQAAAAAAADARAKAGAEADAQSKQSLAFSEEPHPEEKPGADATAAAAVSKAPADGSAEPPGPSAASVATPLITPAFAPATPPPPPEHRLLNQFLFNDRVAQTSYNQRRDKGTITEPPGMTNASGSCSQWEIYDAYTADIAAQAKLEEATKAKAIARKGAAGDGADVTVEMSSLFIKHDNDEGDMIPAEAITQPLHIIQRMINQNLHNDLAMDLKYWEDEADEIRTSEGTLLPLWRFVHPEEKQKEVTVAVWHPVHSDLLGVAYGSFDWVKQGKGGAAVFSLKNCAGPEFFFPTQCGVQSLDFNKQLPHLMAVGLQDGSVRVYDLRYKTDQPIADSYLHEESHIDPVMDVKWRKVTEGMSPCFASVSIDSRVISWTYVKGNLSPQELMTLKAVGRRPVDDAADTLAELGHLTGGCCIQFKETDEETYLVGCDDGLIVQCSTAYDAEYLASYGDQKVKGGHDLEVHSVAWNPMHSRTFLTASADSTIQLWDADIHDKAILTFDMGSNVGDISWAPFSSTIFAAVTLDRQVHVFDLSANTAKSLHSQKVCRKGRLNRVDFNPQYPVVVVGDDRGVCTVLKLSPNLRKPTQVPPAPKASAKDEGTWQAGRALEEAKMEAILEDAKQRRGLRFFKSAPDWTKRLKAAPLVAAAATAS